MLWSRLNLSGDMPPCVFPAGWARPRNFAHNHFPFRAESHFLYLVGFHIEGALLVLSEDGRVLYMDPPEEDAALWSGPAPDLDAWSSRLGIEVRPLSELELERCAVLPPQDEETAVWLTALLDREVIAQGGAELDGDDRALAQGMIRQRLVKDEAELSQMHQTARISAEAHRRGMLAAAGARYEADVRAAIEAHFCCHGLGTAYNSIVTTRGEILHAERSDRALSVGDLMLCDVGAESPEGYAADITRTWPISGKFSPTQRAIYEAVLDVQRRAIDRVLPGAAYADVHRQAVLEMGAALSELGILRGSPEACVESGAVSVFFPHGLGHLLGLDVHDMEDLGDAAGYDEASWRSSDPVLRYLRLSRVLEDNMVVTIEPGFYLIPALLERARNDRNLSRQIDWTRLDAFSDVRGIRIEDDVVVRGDSPWVLSQDAPKRVEDIEDLMSGSSA